MKLLRRRRIAALVVFTLALWSLLVAFSDTRHLAASIGHLSLGRMILVLFLSGVNYWIRIIRFHWLSTRVAKKPIDRQLNGVIFFSGLSMNLTPARVGEVVKAYFQQQFFGESFARMAPIAFLERLTDAIAMLALMSIGVLSFHLGRGAFFALAFFILLLVFFLHHRSLGARAASLMERTPLRKFARAFSRVLDTSYELTGLVPLFTSILLGIVAWISEASGLLVLAQGVGVVASLKSLYLILFTFSASAAAGFLSILPGGLGVNELSTIGLLERLLTIPYSDALVITFAFRIVTLWIGILLGIISLLYLEQRLGQKNHD